MAYCVETELSLLSDYYKNPQMLASSDKDSGLEHMEEEEEVADLEEQQESLDNQMELDENEERYEDQPVAGSLNDNLMREDDHETEGDANKSVGNLMQNIQMTDDEEEREKTDGNQSGDSLMKRIQAPFSICCKVDCGSLLKRCLRLIEVKKSHILNLTIVLLADIAVVKFVNQKSANQNVPIRKANNKQSFDKCHIYVYVPDTLFSTNMNDVQKQVMSRNMS
eukprot:gene18481-20333_t